MEIELLRGGPGPRSSASLGDAEVGNVRFSSCNVLHWANVKRASTLWLRRDR